MEMLAALEASPFSTWLRESPSIWAYPTVLTLHTVGLAVLVGANWMVDLRVLGFAPAIPASMLSRAFPAMWAGFWLNAVTGALLFAGDPTTKGTTAVFMWKLVLVGLGVVLMIALKRKLYGRDLGPQGAGVWLKAIAVASLLIWVAAIATGRWMAYV
jgi:hypothetical protein